MEATITQMAALNVQVCVPVEWTDEQAIAFAEKEYPCGTTNGWCPGKFDRVNCAERTGMVHVVLDA